MRIVIGLFTLWAMTSSLWAQTDAECPYHIAGRVFQADTGEPLPFASIRILGTDRGTVSDGEGYYRLDALCDTAYIVVCSHISCDHLEHTIHPARTQVHNFELIASNIRLETIVVQESALRPKGSGSEVVINANELGVARGLSIAASLHKVARLDQVRSGGVDSKPMIQGLRGERVLIVNDGVRMEGQQWGDDHAPPVDPFSAAEIRVVHGAGGVAYGAGALGGVIIVEPKALPTEAGLSGDLGVGVFSNGRMDVLNGQLEGRLAKLPLSWRVRGTLRRGGNLRSPNYFLENTGVSSYDLGYSLAYDFSKLKSSFRYETRRSSSGIFAGSHIGNLTDLEQAIVRGRPLSDGAFNYELARPLGRVFHETAQWDNTYRSDRLGKLKLELSRQFNRRQEFDAHRRFGELPTDFDDPEIEFELTAYQANAQWEHRTWKNLQGGPGFQFRALRNTTDRGALLPDYRSTTSGVYWIERWRKYPFPLEFEAGLRYDYQLLAVDELSNGNQVADQTYDNISATAGMIFHWNEQVDLRAHFGTAFRPPHPNELYSDGVHHGAASYERGNPQLKAEQARQIDLGVRIDKNERWQLDASVYIQYIQDFIFLEPEAEPVLTIRGAFPAFRYAQADARLMGADLNIQLNPNRHWQLTAGASSLRARNLDRNEWLTFMPADRLQAGLRYFIGKEEKNPHYIGLELQHRFQQERLSTGQDFAAPPAAYTLLELSAATKLQLAKKELQISLQIFNLANVTYRDYLDRFRYFAAAPGRNIALSMRLPID